MVLKIAKRICQNRPHCYGVLILGTLGDDIDGLV